MKEEKLGKLTFRVHPEDSGGGLCISGLNYQPGERGPNPTASLTTFGDLHLHDFSVEQLACLSDYAQEAAKSAKPLPEETVA